MSKSCPSDCMFHVIDDSHVCESCIRNPNLDDMYVVEVEEEEE